MATSVVDETTATGPPTREAARKSTTPVITPRRSLPNGRALVGALLVTTAAVGAFAVAVSGDDGPDTQYLVVLNDVEAGAAIELGDVALLAMTLPEELASNSLRSTTALEGATALRTFRAGELLDVRDLNGAAFVDGSPLSDVHELTIPVPLDRSPSRLLRGDRVTILAYDDDTSTVALEDVLVLTYETDTNRVGASSEARLTLAIDDAAAVIRASHLSFLDLTVVLSSRAIDDDYPSEFQSATLAPTVGVDE